MCICRTRPSLNMFCPWSCEEERGSYLFCKDILDVPFQLLSSKYQSNCRRPLTMQIAKKQARTTSKYAITKYTQVFLYFRSVKCHRFTANEDYLFFLIVAVPVYPPQYYWPLLHVSRFLYSLNKTKVPASTSKSRKIRIVARRRFWRFLLVH